VTASEETTTTAGTPWRDSERQIGPSADILHPANAGFARTQVHQVTSRGVVRESRVLIRATWLVCLYGERDAAEHRRTPGKIATYLDVWPGRVHGEMAAIARGSGRQAVRTACVGDVW